MNPHPGILCPGSSPPRTKTGQETAASAAAVQWDWEDWGEPGVQEPPGKCGPEKKRLTEYLELSSTWWMVHRSRLFSRNCTEVTSTSYKMKHSDYVQGKQSLPNDSGNTLKHSVQNRAEFPPLGVYKLQLKNPAQPDWVTFCSEQECDVGVASKGPTPATLFWIALMFCSIFLLMQYRNNDPTHPN